MEDVATIACFADLKRQLYRALDSVIPPASNVVYWDIPVSNNVGDMAISLGTRAWIADAKHKLLDLQTRRTYRPVALDRCTIILLNGGGNLGDLYVHQDFREEILRQYPDNPVVFLPQTVFYQDSSNLEVSIKRISSHRRVDIFLRDVASLNRLRGVLDAKMLHLAPDMATALHPMSERISTFGPKAPSRSKNLYLLRRDIEARQDREKLLPAAAGSVDWPDMLGWNARARIRFFRNCETIIKRRNLSQSATRFSDTTWTFLGRAASVLRGADRITTDRLHGHILTSMLGIPNTLLDNTYGKNSNYVQTWHRDLTIGRLTPLRSHS